MFLEVALSVSKTDIMALKLLVLLFGLFVLTAFALVLATSMSQQRQRRHEFGELLFI